MDFIKGFEHSQIKGGPVKKPPCRSCLTADDFTEGLVNALNIKFYKKI